MKSTGRQASDPVICRLAECPLHWGNHMVKQVFFVYIDTHMCMYIHQRYILQRLYMYI